MDTKNLQSVFLSFSAGKSEMANKEFAKCTKDCHLLDKKFTSTDVDLVFSKVKTKTSKNLTYQQFDEAVKVIATKKGLEYEALVELLINAGGPQFTGTKADYVKFHDDKSLYTGVYAKGGPTNVDVGHGGGISDISQLCDRGASDIRGSKK